MLFTTGNPEIIKNQSVHPRLIWQAEESISIAFYLKSMENTVDYRNIDAHSTILNSKLI